MPVTGLTVPVLVWPSAFVGSSRAAVRRSGLASHYVRKKLPWQVRHAATLAKMPYTALYPTPRQMAWRFVFGTFAKECAGLKGRAVLKEPGRVAPAGLIVPPVAAAIQLGLKGKAKILDDIGVKRINEILGFIPSRAQRTAHTLDDLKKALVKVLGPDKVNELEKKAKSEAETVKSKVSLVPIS